MLIYIEIYLILFFTGIGYSLLFINNEFGGTMFSFAISPILGASLIIIPSVFFISWDLGLLRYKLIFLFLISLSLLFLIIFFINNRTLIFKQYFTIPDCWTTFGYVFVLFLIFLVGYRLNNFSNGVLFYRLNADIAAYGAASNHILNYGNLKSINDPLTYEILIMAHRWGLPSLIALLSSLIYQVDNVYQVLFPTIYIIFISGILVVGVIMKSAWQDDKDKYFLPIFTIMLLFNGAILNFLNEGFYPQIISIVYLNIGLSIFAILRFKAKTVSFSWNLIKPSLFFVPMMFAVLLTVYSESFIIGILVVAGCFLLDYIMKDKMSMKVCGFFSILIISSLILVYPLFYKIILYSSANISNMNNVGYPQPKWTFPSEIIGLSNIYSNVEPESCTGG